MIFLKPYKSLQGYLERFTIIECGGFHTRIHRIRSCDRTPFLHTHPFNFISIILRGGYLEKTERGLFSHSIGSIIFRKSNEFHRIMEVQPNTLTLFITWGKGDWALKRDDQTPGGWIEYKPGIYRRNLYGRDRFCKFKDYWHRAHDTVQEAMAEPHPSIDQTTESDGTCFHPLQ